MMESMLQCLGTQPKVSPAGIIDRSSSVKAVEDRDRSKMYVSPVEIRAILREVHFTILMYSIYLPVSRDSDGLDRCPRIDRLLW